MPFFFNDTATTEIYTLSLHDALPICAAAHAPAPREEKARGSRAARRLLRRREEPPDHPVGGRPPEGRGDPDRKSTRLNSSHSQISYAVFCLKKKKKKHTTTPDINTYT